MIRPAATDAIRCASMPVNESDELPVDRDVWAARTRAPFVVEVAAAVVVVVVP